MTIVKRLTWFKRKNRGSREQKLAYEYLKRKDYVRAVIYAQEGTISKALYEEKLALDDHCLRKKKLNQMAELDEFKELRNKLAHGNKSNIDEINDLTKDEKTLLQYLKESFKKLFG